MKNEDCLRIFGKNPSYEEFLNWVLKNNPKTFEPWDPPLNSDEIAIISNPNLKDEPLLLWTPAEELKHFFERFDFNYIREIIGYVREAKEKKVSIDRIPFLLEKLKKYDKEYEYIFEKNKIFIEGKINILIRKLLEEVGENPKSVSKLNIQDWEVARYAPITHLKTGIEIWGSSSFIDSPLDEKKWEEYWDIFKGTLIKLKREDIIKNPQNWRIERSVNIMYGEFVVDVVRKDNDKDRLSKNLFTSEEFAEFERKLEGQKNSKFWLPLLLILILILLFAFFFFWWYRKKSK